MSTEALDVGPWYRQIWPWILIAIPASSIVFGILMLGLALGTNNSLVVDDYYRAGKAINQRIERDRRAAALGIAARLDAAGDRLALMLEPLDGSEPGGATLPPQITLRWAHVTQDTRDGEAILKPVGQGRYLADAGAHGFPASGRFRLHVEPFGGDWRLVSPVVVLERQPDVLILPPEPDR